MTNSGNLISEYACPLEIAARAAWTVGMMRKARRVMNRTETRKTVSIFAFRALLSVLALGGVFSVGCDRLDQIGQQVSQSSNSEKSLSTLPINWCCRQPDRLGNIGGFDYGQ